MDKQIGLVKKFYDEKGIEQISIWEVMHMVEFAKWLEQYAARSETAQLREALGVMADFIYRHNMSDAFAAETGRAALTQNTNEVTE